MSRKQRVSLEPTRRSTPMSHAAFDICEIRKAMPDGGSEIVGIEDVYDALVESERIVGGFTRFRFTEEGGLAQSPNFVVEGTKPPATASSLAFQNPLCREPGTRHTNQACKLDSKLNTRITATERTKSRQLQYCGHLHSPPMAFSPSSLSPRTSLNKVEPHHNLDTAAEAVLVSRISEMVSHVHHLFSELCSFDFDQDQVNSHLSARFEDLSCRFTRSPRNHHERNGKLHKILVHLFFCSMESPLKEVGKRQYVTFAPNAQACRRKSDAKSCSDMACINCTTRGGEQTSCSRHVCKILHTGNVQALGYIC